MQKYTLKGHIYTNVEGCQKLIDFYNYASSFKDCWFHLDLLNLEWIDANLCSELFLYCHLLKSKNRIKFFIDYSALKGHLNVLSRNGFAYYVVDDKSKFQQYDERESVIPLKAFKIEDADKFAEYVEKIFLKQRGLENLNKDSKDSVSSSYFEIFENVGIHSNTETPIFCCGQYFPEQSELKFTLTDYGVGFLSKIKNYTLNEITTADKAIDWAVKGGSTKPKQDNIKGGNGLKKMMMLCYKTGGVLAIVSDGCYWKIENKKIDTQQLKNHRKGTTIHLIFRNLK